MNKRTNEWTNEHVGDAYRYTLTPVFASLPTSFHCYIRRRSPRVIYRVSLSITLPGHDALQSPTLVQQVLATSADNLRLHHDRQTLFDMLTVEHDVGGPPLDNELLLTGRQSTETTHDVDMMTYSALPANIRSIDTNDTELIVLYSPGVALTLLVTT